MKLDRVTITGADDGVRPQDLMLLSAQYPFVEWGILAGARNARPRFPSSTYFRELQYLQESEPQVKLSLHLCGVFLEYFMLGSIAHLPADLEKGFRRIQLNFHGENVDYNLPLFVDAMAGLDREFIFQIDGHMGQQIISDVQGARCQSFSYVPLFDASHGEGRTPQEWPQPFDPDIYHGYAGGLGPDNLAREIPRIARAAGDCRVWIDMETKVRTGDRFDLDKVRQCLEICKPYVYPYYQPWRQIMGFDEGYVPRQAEAEYRYNAMVNHSVESGMIDRLNHAYAQCKKECDFE